MDDHDSEGEEGHAHGLKPSEHGNTEDDTGSEVETIKLDDDDFARWREEKTQDWRVNPRARNVLVTTWEGHWDEQVEPVFNVKGLEMAAGQQERGSLDAKTPRRHRHDALHIAPGESIEAVLKRVYPNTGLRGKDIRIAANGRRFAILVRYCTKSSHRWPGVEPMYFNCEPELSKMPLAKRKLEVEEKEAEIMACDTKHELARSKTYRYNPSYVTAVHANRPLLAAIGERVWLCGFEIALLEMLERAPLPMDASIHWFCPPEDTEVNTGRLAGMLKKVASRKGQSAQIALHDSDGNMEALKDHLSPRTKVIFVRQFQDSPIPLQRLKWLKTEMLVRTSPCNRYDVQEVGPRHVVVFADAEPELVGPGRKNIRVWEATPSHKEWEYKDALLKYTAASLDGPFLNLCTAGSSGALKSEIEGME